MKQTWKEHVLYTDILTKPRSLSITLDLPIFTSCTDLQLVFHLFFKAEILGALLLLVVEFSKNAAVKPLWKLTLAVSSSLFWSLGFQSSRVTGIAVSWAFLISPAACPSLSVFFCQRDMVLWPNLLLNLLFSPDQKRKTWRLKIYISKLPPPTFIRSCHLYS